MDEADKKRRENFPPALAVNGGGVVALSPFAGVRAIRLPCIHLGDPTGEAIECKTCQGSVRIKLNACAVHGQCTTAKRLDGVACCAGCNEYSDGPDPTVGVVIGSYNLPKLIALQVKLIRDHCGDVPILIVDDCSDGYGHTPGPETILGQLRKVVTDNVNVNLFVHPTRFGHASGDLSKVWTGLQWAQVRGIKVLATLSQRFLIDRPRWLQDGAKALVRSGCAMSSKATTGRETFPIRSEAMLLNVDICATPATLDHLMPRKMTPIPGEWGIAAEHVYADSLRDRWGGRMHPWDLLNNNRYERCPGVVWHCANSPDDYRQLAQRYGLELDAGFTTNGWREHQGAGYQG